MPYPAGDVFAGRVFQAWDVIKVVVIQPIIDGLEGALDVAEVHDPASGFHGIAADYEAHMEGVSVQSGTLVSLGNIGQAMGCLEVKFLVDFHVF